jgi:hypothetical protein
LVKPGLAWLSGVLLVVGLVIFFGVGRNRGRPTRFRPDRWDGAATLVAGLCLGSLAVVIVVAALQPGLLLYYPYPRAVWPEVHLPLLLACLPLALPAWVLGRA